MVKGSQVYNSPIKHHERDLFPGAEIGAEFVVFSQSGQVSAVNFLIKHGALRNHEVTESVPDAIAAAYGPPDPPRQLPSSSTFRSSTYGGANASTTLDQYGKSINVVQQWTRQHYVIRWGAAKYESYANMVEEDSNPMYALFHTNLANSIEEVSFAPIVVRPGYEGSSITEISSVPAGAQIAVDGVNAGVTPFKFWLMKKDQPRHITVSMPGYKPFEITTVPTGEPISIPVTLQPE